MICIGIGAGAGGNINGWGYYKAPVVPKYLGMADRGFFFPDVLTEPSDNAELISEIIGDIEQGFMDMRKFPVVNESLNSVLKNWEKAGLISFDRDYANLTVAGKFWGVNLTQAVIELTNIVCGEKDE